MKEILAWHTEEAVNVDLDGVLVLLRGTPDELWQAGLPESKKNPG